MLKSKPSVFLSEFFWAREKATSFTRSYFFNPVANVCRILEEFRSEKKTTSTKWYSLWSGKVFDNYSERWGRKFLKTHRVHDFFSDFKTFCYNSIQNFWWNWQSFCGKALLYIENGCVTIDVEPPYSGMKYFSKAHSYFCLFLSCFHKSWPHSIKGQMP